MRVSQLRTASQRWPVPLLTDTSNLQLPVEQFPLKQNKTKNSSVTLILMHGLLHIWEMRKTKKQCTEAGRKGGNTMSLEPPYLPGA